jgi:hypothetical protein
MGWETAFVLMMFSVKLRDVSGEEDDCTVQFEEGKSFDGLKFEPRSRFARSPEGRLFVTPVRLRLLRRSFRRNQNGRNLKKNSLIELLSFDARTSSLTPELLSNSERICHVTGR